jgi:LPS export ABC transporter protein LptC
MSAFFKKNWPLVGIAILVLTVLFYLGRSHKEVIGKPILPGATAEGVKLENMHFTHESTGDGLRWTMDAKEVRISEDRQQVSFTDFLLKLEPQNRQVVHLEGKNGQYDKAAGQLVLSGGLRGRTEDGYTIVTESAVFNQNEGMLTTDEAVFITGPFLSVEGRGMAYDVAREVLEIKEEVKTQVSGRSWIS